MAYTFFKARGLPVGKSLVEDDLLGAARDIEQRAAARRLRLELPVDHVVAAEGRGGRAGRDAGRRRRGHRRAHGPGHRAARPSRPTAASSPVRRRSSGTARWACSRSTRSPGEPMEVARAVADVKGTTDRRRRRLDCGGREGRRHQISIHAHLSTGGGASLRVAWADGNVAGRSRCSSARC